jgi:hypothetical protein
VFDTVGIFRKQFVQHGADYLYYVNAKSGGKLVTATEFESLVADWQREAGFVGQLKFVAIVVVAVAVWTLFSDALGTPDLYDIIFPIIVAIAISWRLLWLAFSAQRLVKNRVEVTPPRPLSTSRREARALLTWPIIIFVTLISGLIFVGMLASLDRSFSAWAWIIGSGIMFSSNLWIAVQKFRDLWK